MTNQLNNKEAQYSIGTGSRAALKYAAKLPNLLTVISATRSLDLTPKISRNEVHSEPEVVDAFIVLVVSKRKQLNMDLSGLELFIFKW